MALSVATAILRVSPVALLLFVVASLGASAKSAEPGSPNAIRNVVVAHVQPRRALILTILLLAALTYVLDAVLLLVLLLVDGVRQGATAQWRGVELADLAGVLAFTGLALLGISKDKKGVDIWARKRVKAFAFFALVLDIAYLVLLILTVPIFPGSKVPLPPNSPSGFNVPNFLHFLAVVFRILLLLPLLPVLTHPAVHYSSLQPPPAEPTSASQLLQPAGSPDASYGTFAPETSIRPGSPPVTKPAIEGYDLAPGAQTLAVEQPDLSRKSSRKSKKSKSGSRSSSRSSKKKEEPIASDTLVDEPESIDPLVVSTNPVTTDTQELQTSYAATAAAALDKEKKEEAPIAFPSSPVEDDDKPIVGFPTSTTNNDDTASVRTTPQPAAVTFSPEGTPGSGTPDNDDKKEKRKRISSQNFQRIARRISLVPKRTGSTSSGPVSKDSDSATKVDSGTSTPRKEGSGTSNFFARLSREDSRASRDVERSGSLDLTSGEGTEGSIKGKGRPGNEDKKKRRMSLKVPGLGKKDKDKGAKDGKDDGTATPAEPAEPEPVTTNNEMKNDN